MAERGSGGILVFAAMPEEAAVLRRRARAEIGGRRPRRAPVTRGHVGGTPAWIAVTGEGPRCAAVAAPLIAQLAPRAVLVVGTAGALTPGLAPGALVVGAEIRRGARTFAAPDALVYRAASAADALPARVVTVDTPALDPGRKAALAAELADDEAVAVTAAAPDTARPRGAAPLAVVDQESAVFVEAAERAGVPWVVVRAVLDGAGDSVPAYLDACRDERGAVRRDAALVRGLAHPRSWRALAVLGWRARRSSRNLAEAAEAIAVDGALWDRGDR